LLACDLPAVLPARDWGFAFLGRSPLAARCARGAQRSQRRRRWPADRRVLRSDLDCRHHQRRGRCTRHRRVSSALRLADAALARGDSLGCCGRNDARGLSAARRCYAPRRRRLGARHR
jgi:hypothetical protein